MAAGGGRWWQVPACWNWGALTVACLPCCTFGPRLRSSPAACTRKKLQQKPGLGGSAAQASRPGPHRPAGSGGCAGHGWGRDRRAGCARRFRRSGVQAFKCPGSRQQAASSAQQKAALGLSARPLYLPFSLRLSLPLCAVPARPLPRQSQQRQRPAPVTFPAAPGTPRSP